MKLLSVKNAPSWLKQHPQSLVYWVSISRAGRARLERSTKESSSKERAKHLGEKMIARWLGKDINTGEDRNPRFKEVCTEFLEYYEARLAKGKIRVGTMENSRLYVGRYLREEFGDMRIRSVSEVEWQRFVMSFQAANPTKILENHWKHMAMVMNYAHRMGMVEKPWEVENPDPKRDTGRVLCETEKTAILQAAKPNLRDQLLFAMTMGMRLREHLKLSYDLMHCCHVDLKKKTVTVCAAHCKTNKARTMAMSPQVYRMLKDRFEGYYGRARKSNWVFPAPGNHSQPIHQNKSAWRTAKANAGIKGKLRYHHLRHTFMTECAKLVREGGVSVVLVCNYANMSIKTFERVYLHLNHEDTEPVSKLIAVNTGGSKDHE